MLVNLSFPTTCSTKTTCERTEKEREGLVYVFTHGVLACLYTYISHSQHSSVVHAVARFLEVLRYETEGRGFDTP